MNKVTLASFTKRLPGRIKRFTSLFDFKLSAKSFDEAGGANAIKRIYVINLDRKPDRWKMMKRELHRLGSKSGAPLMAMTRRIPAVDAQYLQPADSKGLVVPGYSLADQLAVEPKPGLAVDASTRARQIKMTSQEIAVSLSHIAVWKKIASGDAEYALVLEDDVYFCFGFASAMDKTWQSLIKSQEGSTFDLLYLSFDEVSPKLQHIENVRSPSGGVWFASGYVLSKSGASKLLARLPTHGPIDLWMNLQFNDLNVFLSRQPIIEQRADIASTNSYSIMPILSEVGIYNYDKPRAIRSRNLAAPVFVFGPPGTGLTSIAVALSMLGYTCCSDITELPTLESHNLLARKRGCHFNAYVNVGSLYGSIAQLTVMYPKAKIIFTNPDGYNHAQLGTIPSLLLTPEEGDKWSSLCGFLGLEYPAFPYPVLGDIGQRPIVIQKSSGQPAACKNWRFDHSPWVITGRGWTGIAVSGQAIRRGDTILQWPESGFNDKDWNKRDDTFPGNASLFRPGNVAVENDGSLSLCLREWDSPIRSFSSGAVNSQRKFLYGSFAAEIKSPDTPGLITGVFLHRNNPHQEIDIEFLGKDTTKMLVNVFYNPGADGAKLEYAYRGAPTSVDLGFDASKEFHRYEIEWRPGVIRWLVDGAVVYERNLWNPTPIPYLPLEFNVNLWHPRSKALAGRLSKDKVPAYAYIRNIEISEL